MKTLLTMRERLNNPGETKQVQISDCDFTSFLMIKASFRQMGLDEYIEMEYTDDKVFIRICEYKK